jgi:hypothetical protein
MNRLLTFLIISLLFSQSAFAFYDIEFCQQQEQSYTQNIHQNEDGSISGDYDHCGHACSHIVGLISNNTIDTCVALKSNVISIKNTTSSISYQPPVPPPTV